MIAQANVTHIVVGKDDDLATSSETRDDLIAGQIGVFIVGSATATTSALSAGQRFQIVYRRVDGALIESPVINYSDISSKNSTDPVAATERVRALGFNGTTGSIDVSNSEDYVVHYNWYDNTKTFGRGKPVKFIAYQSSSSATQVEIAEGLVQSAVRNNSKEVYPVFIAELLINNAGAVITGTGNLTAVNGSKYVTAATDVDAVVAVGDYIRLGTVAGAAVTDDAYRIVSLDTTNEVMELDRAFQGTSGTYTEANCDYVAAATAATQDCGVVFTGQAMPFEAGKKKYSKIEFELILIGEGFGSTTVSTTSVPSKGIGTYEEIAEVEWFLRGNRGETYRVASYPVNYTPDALSGETYQIIALEYKDTNAKTIDREVASYQAMIIATEDESASTVNTDLQTVLGI